MIKSIQPSTVNFRQNTALLLCLPVFKTRISRVDHMMITKKLGSTNQSSTNIQKLYPHRFDDLNRWLNHATIPKLLYTIDRIRHHNPQNWWNQISNTAHLHYLFNHVTSIYWAMSSPIVINQQRCCSWGQEPAHGRLKSQLRSRHTPGTSDTWGYSMGINQKPWNYHG